MGGPQAMLGWIVGAVLCLCDSMVWAELGSILDLTICVAEMAFQLSKMDSEISLGFVRLATSLRLD